MTQPKHPTTRAWLEREVGFGLSTLEWRAISRVAQDAMIEAVAFHMLDVLSLAGDQDEQDERQRQELSDLRRATADHYRQFIRDSVEEYLAVVAPDHP